MQKLFPNYEKSMVSIVFQTLTELGSINKSLERSKEGYLYTILNTESRTIEIGFMSEDELFKRTLFLHKFEICSKRESTKREERLLKATLLEMGYKQFNEESRYHFSQALNRHLQMLGCPISSLINKNYKR